MPIKQTLIAISIMLISSISLIYFKNSEDKLINKSLSDFPATISQWQGTKSRFDENVYDILGVDDSILYNYYNEKRETIQLYIGYYQSQREGEIIHSPKNCMPGSGWDIIDNTLLALNLENHDGEPIKIIKLKLHNGINSQIAFYWFHSRGRIINSEYAQKIYLVWDSITRNRTDGSFVRLLSPITDGNEAQTIERLKEFSEQIIPLLNDFIPT
jgi:EpsI family protein